MKTKTKQKSKPKAKKNKPSGVRYKSVRDMLVGEKVSKEVLKKFDEFISQGRDKDLDFYVNLSKQIGGKTNAIFDEAEKDDECDSDSEYELIQNAIMICSNGHILNSAFRHDYQSEIVGEEVFMTDGGTEYIRRSVNTPDSYEDLTITKNTPFDEVVRKLVWGTRGPKGDKPLTYKKLINLETDHLRAILNTQPQIKGKLHEKVIKFILGDREEQKLNNESLGPYNFDLQQ